jgi:hypothetical protein
LSAVRQQKLQAAQGNSSSLEKAAVPIADQGSLLNLVNVSLAATNAFTADTAASPVGMLNLERMEMTPAGIEQGELLATIPLAPGETTTVVQQEWSVVNSEFTSISTDSLENYSETGVTENTELAQATTSQIAHSNQFNVTASASGGCGFVSGSASTTFGSQDQNSQSATDSRKDAVTTVKNASSRVKQSRKVTISASTTTGTSQSAQRTIQNPSTTDPMRVDYFSMMRKWHVGLYRYGLRLTYDITVPEPGAALREVYQQLDSLNSQINQAFSFPLAYSDITDQNYTTYASQYGATIPSPLPAATLIQTVGGPIPNLPSKDGDGDLIANQIQFTVPDGYEVQDISLDLNLGNYGSYRNFSVLGTNVIGLQSNQLTGHFDITKDNNNWLYGARGSHNHFLLLVLRKWPDDVYYNLASDGRS